MSGTIESTIESPFEFYNQILFYNGIKLIEESFYFQNPYTEGYKFYNEIGNFTGWIKTLPDSVDVLNLSTYFVKALKVNSAESLNLLEGKIESLDNPYKKDFLKNQLDHIQSFHLKISKSKDLKYSNVIEEELEILVKDIFFKFNSLQVRHKLFDKINAPKKLISSFFQCKEYPLEFYSKLYDLTSNLLLIDETETFEEDFITILTSSNPENDLCQIQFTKNNYVISYYLRKLEPFFDNLNFNTIELSKSFYNKQNKLLTASDLSASLSRGKDKALATKKSIDNALLSLI